MHIRIQPALILLSFSPYIALTEPGIRWITARRPGQLSFVLFIVRIPLQRALDNAWETFQRDQRKNLGVPFARVAKTTDRTKQFRGWRCPWKYEERENRADRFVSICYATDLRRSEFTGPCRTEKLRKKLPFHCTWRLLPFLRILFVP